MFKTILVAFDGSDHAQEAMELACDLAGKYGAVLHIINIPQIAGETMMIGYSAVPVPPTAEALEKAGSEMIESARALAAEHGIEQPATKITNGDPARCIVDYAKENNADLIVMGRRGLGDFGAILVGSVTHRVQQLADCAVLTAK